MTVLSSELMQVLEKSFDGREEAMLTTIAIMKEFQDFLNRVANSKYLKMEEKKNLMLTMFDDMKYHIIKYPEEFAN